MTRQLLGPGATPQANFGAYTGYYRPVFFLNSVVPTDDGTTTGTIPDLADGPYIAYITLNGTGDANDIVILPTPVVGTEIYLIGGNAGYELRSNSPTTVAINGGTGAAAESAIAASLVLWVRCTSATTWVANNFAAAGTEAAEEAAA